MSALKALGGSAHGFHQEAAIELGSLPVASRQQQRRSHAEAVVGTDRRLKSRQKYRELLRREAMKFSHSIQFNAVPEWTSHYINYSNLKKL